MSISLNNLAIELINWCENVITKKKGYEWHNEDQLIANFTNYLNTETKIKAAKGQPETNHNSKNHIYLTDTETNSNNGIIAEFLYDGNKKQDRIYDIVNETSAKLNNSNIESNYHSSIRCIVSLYNDLNNRRTFHENEFIEIYNDFGVGCAIKRLQ